MTAYSRSERVELCDLLETLGPDAPTLCAGWRTADLAAHLIIREGHPLAASGMLISPLSGLTTRTMTRLTTDHPYPDLVRRVRRGPPRWSPTGLIPRLEAEANTVEFFVHHEDVRRAQPDWEPRALPAGLEDQLWRRLGGMARMLARRAPVPVVFRRTGGGAGEVRVGGDGQPVVVSGDAGELMLYAFGRQRAARVDAEGPEDAVRALGAAPLGL